MNIHEDLAFKLAQVSRSWRTKLNYRLRALGLTQARWLTLLQLSQASGGVTQRELAQLVGVERATIGRLLDGLEYQGLIERRAIAGDRRAHSVHLTPAALPVLKDINAIAQKLRLELLMDIPLDDMKTCVAVLRRIGNRLEKHDSSNP
jgi:MarR family transcriptional regulator for hemolysin